MEKYTYSNNKEIKALQKESDKHYGFIENFVTDYCKEDEDRQEFFEHLNGYLNAEIEIEKFCGQ